MPSSVTIIFSAWLTCPCNVSFVWQQSGKISTSNVDRSRVQLLLLWDWTPPNSNMYSSCYPYFFLHTQIVWMWAAKLWSHWLYRCLPHLHKMALLIWWSYEVISLNLAYDMLFGGITQIVKELPKLSNSVWKSQIHSVSLHWGEKNCESGCGSSFYPKRLSSDLMDHMNHRCEIIIWTSG